MGSLADWVAAVGTVGTLLIGLVVLIREVRDIRRRHASRVIAWIDFDTPAVCVRNSGDEPVTKVMAALFVAGHYAEPSVDPNSDPPFTESWEWLAPGEEQSFTPDGVDWHADLFPPQIRVEFTDMTQRRWLRDESGLLSRKLVIPFRQDWTKIPTWKRNERATRKARALFTRWQWPNI